MALLSKTSIYIDSKQVANFKHLYLNQQVNAHHILEVVFRMDTFESESSEFGEKSKEFLGKKITVQIGSISSQSNLGILEFQGIISEIKISKTTNSGSGDEIVILAKSPTLKADNGAHYNSYTEKDLSYIVEDVLKPHHLTYDIAPRYKEKIDYCVQQNESGYAYISRLAAQYGEWFYYNGNRVIFGQPEIKETQLQYGVDLDSFEVSLIPKPQKHEFYTTDYLTDEIYENNEQAKPNGVSAMTGLVYNKSNDIFSQETVAWNNNNNSSIAKIQLEAKVKAQHESTVINEVIIQGSSSNPGVKIGNFIKVDGEKYRVTKVIHTTDQSGHYKNDFLGVSGNFDAYPFTYINSFPKSESQLAIVKDNYDPDALGRIKVQFPWQKKQNKTTPWIRMMSPHAGSGKGFYCLPEVGEEVVVNFEGGNAEIPYVMAGLYTVNSRPPANSNTPGNDITIFMTRIGCQFIFNDNTGSITIIDKSKSKIVFNGEGDITIKASANINILALSGAINIDSPTINIGSEANKTDLTNIHGKKIHIHASELLELLSDIELSAKGMQSSLEGTTEIIVEGTQVKLDGTAMTEIKGGQVKLN